MNISEKDSKGNHFGIWRPVALRTKTTPDELLYTLRKKIHRFKDIHPLKCFEAIFNGTLPSVSLSPYSPVSNKIMDKLIKATYPARLVGAHSPEQDMLIRWLAIGTTYTAPAGTQEQLFNEVLRKTPLTQAQDGKYAKLIMFLDFAEGNQVEAQIAAGTNNKGVITVDDATGINIGDAIRVSTAPQQSFSKVVGISGNELTMDPSEELLTDPVVGQSVLICIGEAGSFANTLATSDPNSGDMFSRVRLRYPKTSGQALFLLHTLFGEAA